MPFSAYPFYKHAGGGGEGDDAREDKYGEALTPETLVQQVRRMIDEYGFGSVKFKGGVLEPDVEIETIYSAAALIAQDRLRRGLGTSGSGGQSPVKPQATRDPWVFAGRWGGMRGGLIR